MQSTQVYVTAATQCEASVPSWEKLDDGGGALRPAEMVLDGQHQLISVGSPGGPLPSKGVEVLAPPGHRNINNTDDKNEARENKKTHTQHTSRATVLELTVEITITIEALLT